MSLSLASAYFSGNWSRGVRVAALAVVAAFAALGVTEGGAIAAEPQTAKVDWTEQGAWNGLTAPDAISAAIELKPHHSRAIARGKRQLARYEVAMNKRGQGELWTYRRTWYGRIKFSRYS